MRSELSSRSRMIKEQKGRACGGEKETRAKGKEERERERERERMGKVKQRRHAKTLKLWTRFSKEPYTCGNANNRETPLLRSGR